MVKIELNELATHKKIIFNDHFGSWVGALFDHTESRILLSEEAIRYDRI